VDLCATDLRGRRTATRSGLSNFLGWDAVDHALLHQSCLHLFADPIAWLNGHCEGAVVLDWKSSIYVLSDLVAISFDNDLLARGVLQALKRPLPVPELFVREETRHAA
jgi:hypothetical protein